MEHVEYADLVDADPAPRELTTTARRYVTGQATYFWGVIAFVFLLLPNALAVSVLKTSGAYVGLVAMFAITAAVIARTAIVRSQLRKIIVHGDQRPAQIVGVERLQVRSGLARGNRDTLWLQVDGRRVKCASWAGDLEGAETHAWIRVLVHAAHPQRAVPVISVT
ncbi:MAG: hypothetical protein H0T46_22670 [Deltaproteobacteria bacterium]|nr:hypothetical protein [Deltaproteobacteria bacterium]